MIKNNLKKKNRKKKQKSFSFPMINSCFVTINNYSFSKQNFFNYLNEQI